MTKIEQFVQEAIRIANDNRHGYSQIDRWGPIDYDCSGLVISVLERAGIPVKTGGATYTGNMYSVFLKHGFIDVTNSVNLRTGAGLKRGDILLNPRRHTEIYIGNGKMVGAKIDEVGGIIGRRKGDQTGREICVSCYKNYPWTCVLRYTGDNTPVKTLNAQPSRPIQGKFIKTEHWYGITQAVCNVRSAPSTSAAVVAQYGKGDRINYDSVYEGDGYRWLSYISYSGQRRYVAYRRLYGDTTPWIRV
ncbi:SH3 domain-containing protein [uncultured Anaerococcus sp.]|uniref:SH3 domain-containing protein n=1 Tax=uncultured Anaerococcus sp. TaxID=293428 RepID=UPI00288B0D12|nr:SH3 domain-containing protein [uncultured Anaerococcus sp.]